MLSKPSPTNLGRSTAAVEPTKPPAQAMVGESSLVCAPCACLFVCVCACVWVAAFELKAEQVLSFEVNPKPYFPTPPTENYGRP